MSLTSKQSYKEPNRSIPPVTTVSEGESSRSTPDTTSIAIQRITWSPVSPVELISPALTLGITLDLNLSLKLSNQTLQRFRGIWDDHVTPLLIADGEVICCVEPDEETLREIITSANHPGVEPGLHIRRLEKTAGRPGDTLIYSDALNLCDQGLIIGALYSDSRDLNYVVSATLKALVSQLQRDHGSLLSILGKTQRRPRAHRALIDITAGECLWVGPITSQSDIDTRQESNWRSLARRFKPDNERIPESGQSGERPLALVTSLANDYDVESNGSKPLLTDYRIPDSVGKRLGKIVVIPNQTSEDTLVDAVALASAPRRHLALSAETSRLAAPDHQKSKEKLSSPAATSTSSMAKTVERQSKGEAQSKTALRIALNRLPRGGKLKLSPLNQDGEMQLDSFDVTGERLVCVSVRDPEKDKK